LKASPVFLDFLNREASRSVGREREESVDVRIIRILAIAKPHSFSANISQVLEYCSSRPTLFAVVSKFIAAGIIDATTQSATIEDFIVSRQKLYQHVPKRYPFFFERAEELMGIRLGTRNDFSMTKSLAQKLLAYEPGSLPLDLSRAHGADRLILDESLAPIQQKLLRRDGRAITRDLLESSVTSEKLSPQQLGASARIISALYMQTYENQRSLRTCTGIPDFPFVEKTDNFPSFDFPVLEGILVALAGRNALTKFDVESIALLYGNGEHQEFGYYVEAFLEASMSVVRPLVNQPGALQSTRVLLIQFLHRELGLSTPLSFGSLSEFFKAATNRLFEHGQRIAERNHLFAERWRVYVPETNIGLVMMTTATDTEDKALFQALAESGFSRSNTLRTGPCFVTEYRFGHKLRLYHLRTSAGSIGVNSAGAALPPTIASLAPEYVISAGICFGLKSSKYGHGHQQLGDVIVAGHVHDYESKRLGDPIRDRGERLPAGPTLLSATRIARDQTTRDGWEIQEGLVLSGQKLVDDKDFVERLRSDFPDAIAGEMEGNAVATACNHAQKQWIVIKGICDWGMDKEDGNQNVAASRACRLAVDAALIVLNSS
jgi:nucleoside phosphorylase